MKKIIITLLTVINLMSVNTSTATNQEDLTHYYLAMVRVLMTNPQENLVSAIDANGNIWEWYGIEDYCYNDYVALIMYDNNTENIYDDEIVKAKYVGYAELFN